MMTLVLIEFGTSTPTELLPGTGARMLMRSALRAAAILLFRRRSFQAYARGGMQFVAGDGRALGDIAQRHFDIKLRQRALHQPGVGHQLFLRFRRLDGGIGKIEERELGQLVIANHGRRRDRDRLGLARRGSVPGGRAGLIVDGGQPFLRRCSGRNSISISSHPGLTLPRPTVRRHSR